MKRIVLSVFAAAAAAVSARAERTITVESMDDESITVALSENEAPQRMYLLYGQLDRGADFSAWDSKVEIGLMGTEATNVTVALPEGWGDTSTCLRFALAAQPDFADEILEYVVSSGGNDIDTGVNDKEIRPKVEVKWSPINDGNTRAVFTSGYNPGCIQIWDDRLRMGGGTMGGGTYFERAVHDCVYVDVADTRTLTITRNGEPCVPTEAYTYAPDNKNFLLFSREGGNYIAARLYSCKIWDAQETGDVPVRDFVPCRKGGVVQLYDLVTKTPYVPRSGVLSAGPTVVVVATVEVVSELVSAAGWREILVTGGIYSGGALTRIRLAFGPGTSDRVLYMGYGAVDCGRVPFAWSQTRRIRKIAAGKSGCSVDVPPGWGDSVTHLRFFLVDEMPSPVDAEWEYVESDGGDAYVLVSATDAPRPIVEFQWRPLVASSGTQIVLANANVQGGIQIFSTSLRMGDSGNAASVTTVKDTDYVDILDNAALTASRNDETLTPGLPFVGFEGQDFSVFSRWGSYGYKSRVYSLKIWSGLDGVLRHYCVPATKKDGEVVLFDKITGKVYARSGGSATSLTAGGASTPGAGVLVVRSLTDALDSSMKLPNANGMLLMIK